MKAIRITLGVLALALLLYLIWQLQGISDAIVAQTRTQGLMPQLRFAPYPDTDFIAFAEQLGDQLGHYRALLYLDSGLVAVLVIWILACTYQNGSMVMAVFLASALAVLDTAENTMILARIDRALADGDLAPGISPVYFVSMLKLASAAACMYWGAHLLLRARERKRVSTQVSR